MPILEWLPLLIKDAPAIAATACPYGSAKAGIDSIGELPWFAVRSGPDRQLV